MSVINTEHYTILVSRPVEQYKGSKEKYIELSTSSDEFEYLPTENVADGSLAFFSNNWTVSAYNKTAGWGDPKQIFE